MKTSAIGLSLWLLASPLGAQWPTFPTPGIPRTADGKPNLAAPAPRTPEGKPDFSGLWAPAPADFTYVFDVIQDPRDESIFLPAAEALFKKHLSDFRRDNPVGHCLPGGPVNILTGLHRIMQSPTVVAMLYQLGSNWYRQIFLDGRRQRPLGAAIKFYPNLREDMLRIVLAHAGEVILTELGESLGTTPKNSSAGAEWRFD